MRFLAVLLVMVSSSLQAADPVVQKLLDHWNKSKTYMVEIASQMPAESYSFRPNEAEMTFGEQMMHIASANLFLTGGLGKPGPAGFDPKKTDKDSAIAALKMSFEASAASFSGLSEADLNGKTVELEGMKLTGLEAILMAFDHVEHHRGQAIVYLRVKGIKPVDYRF